MECILCRTLAGRRWHRRFQLDGGWADQKTKQWNFSRSSREIAQFYTSTRALESFICVSLPTWFLHVIEHIWLYDIITERRVLVVNVLDRDAIFLNDSCALYYLDVLYVFWVSFLVMMQNNRARGGMIQQGFSILPTHIGLMWLHCYTAF